MSKPVALAVLMALAWLSSAGASTGEDVVVVHAAASGEMVLVPPGSFVMGFAADAAKLPDRKSRRERVKLRQKQFRQRCEKDFGTNPSVICATGRLIQSASSARQVFISGFEIDRREVSMAEYRQCVDAGVCSVDALIQGDRRYLKPDWPMVNVTWFEAARYCGWRGKRLPSEAEWEKAARGTDGRPWPWGWQDRLDGGNFGRLDDYVNRAMSGFTRSPGGVMIPLLTRVGDDADGFATLAPPGSFPWGRSPYGADDMAGNVREWVLDYYGPRGYSDMPVINPVRRVPVSGTARVVRGGSWLTTPVESLVFLRHDWRAQGEAPRVRAIDIGFRCARDSRRGG